MKEIVRKIYGEVAANDKDVVNMYENVNEEVMRDIIKFTINNLELGLGLSNEDAAEYFLSEYNKSLDSNND